MLVECDPSIKAIILKIDQDKHDYIVEDLDDQTLVIKESQLQRLKGRLEEVGQTLLLMPIDNLMDLDVDQDDGNCDRNWRTHNKCQRIVGQIE